ncbi:L,D-transpeptidase family protein [Streptomyces sp. AC495_CC817]|uniref:L,D-transpeptidase family protein n=1 Tax=Streptomyces sp. AC495_CC817 TaxID=2823900 RepID=UPI001C27B1DE|nr:L,D-transpeptidase family protein [Streptomyces sp. AC495_CC817]
MSDELTVRLRELAESAERPPLGSGAEVRAAAGRRRRRRRTTAAVAGGCAAAGLAAVLTLNAVSHGTEQRPSTAASIAPSASAEVAEAADATVDLSRRVITVDGRELPISAGRPATRTPTGLMTVTAKVDIKFVTSSTPDPGDEYGEKLAWVLELSPAATGATGESDGGEMTDGPAADNTPDATPGTDGTDGAAGSATTDGAEGADGTDEAASADPSDPTVPTDPTEPPGGTGAEKRTSEAPTRGPATGALWIAALSAEEKAPGDQDLTSGWIGLRTTDARWLYGRLTVGAIVEIRGTTSPPPSTALTPSASPTFTSLG